MVTENGIVIEANASLAQIRGTRSGACQACSSKSTCGISDESDKEVIVTVKNTLNVQKGDYVVVGMKSRPFLIVAFLLYVFPIILMIIGALIGNKIALSIGQASSLLSILTGVVFFVSSYIVIRRKSKTLSEHEAYKPFLIRKRMMAAPDTCSEIQGNRI
jgi:sigma-E factor negative regulatory protein RseC